MKVGATAFLKSLAANLVFRCISVLVFFSDGLSCLYALFCGRALKRDVHAVCTLLEREQVHG